MTKYVVSNIELIKKDYLVDAYTKEAAQEKAHLQPPRTKVSLGEITHSVTPINEYEYNKEWKDLAKGSVAGLDEDLQTDWVGAEITTSGIVRHKSEWVYAHQDGRIEQQKKDHEGYPYPVKDYYDQ